MPGKCLPFLFVIWGCFEVTVDMKETEEVIDYITIVENQLWMRFRGDQVAE